MRRLIVNADDFGVTAGVNRAIVEAHQHTIMTSATIWPASASGFRKMPPRKKPGHSLRVRARFGVGCHLILVDGTSLLPPSPHSFSLAQRRGKNSGFRDTLNEFAVAALTGKINPEEVEAEATVQIRRIQQAGVTPSHFDTHKHVHIFPAVLRPLLRAAKACGIPAVRNPFGRSHGLPLTRIAADLKLSKRLAQISVLRSFAPNFRRETARHGLRTTDGSLGVLVTGKLDVSLFTEIASSMPEGTWEFVAIPATTIPISIRFAPGYGLRVNRNCMC